MKRGLFVLILVGMLVVGLAWGVQPVRGEVILTFTVDSTADYADANTADGICATITGGNVCTLRAAIQQAAASAGPVNIRFNIAGSAPFVIAPSSSLPNITNANILGPNLSGDLIELDGSAAGLSSGLSVVGASSILSITGMQVQNFANYGIYIQNSSLTIGGDTPDKANVIIGNVVAGIQVAPGGSPVVLIKGNTIGLNAASTVVLGNGKGIGVFGGSSSNPKVTIENNLISGNIGWGISFTADKDSGSAIYGNKIGTNASGTDVFPNGTVLDGGGVLLDQSSGIKVGNGTPEKSNLITGNLRYGIQLDQSDNITIQGNVFGATANQSGCYTNYGLDVQGERSDSILIGGETANLGNIFMQGIWLNGGESQPVSNNVVKNNKFGITQTGFMRTPKAGAVGVVMSYATAGSILNNEITHFDYGVRVATTAVGIQVSQNMIYENSRLGIDLGSDGLTLNDDLDADVGANDRQNFPVITQLLLQNVGGVVNLDISGTLNSKASKTYTIEIFSSPVCDSSGYGEGKTYLASVNDVSTNAEGNAVWSKTGIASAPGLPLVGRCYTATATEVTSKSTSEFSLGMYSGLRSFLPAMFK